MMQRSALLLLCCYFLPFLLFFSTTLWVASAFVFIIGCSIISICTLILFLSLRKWDLEARQQKIIVSPPPKQFVLQGTSSPFLPNLISEMAKKQTAQIPKQKEVIHKLEEELNRLKSAQETVSSSSVQEKQEAQKRQIELSDLENTLQKRISQLSQKDEEIAKLQTEVSNLKFELYALFRIDEQIFSDSYSQGGDTKESVQH